MPPKGWKKHKNKSEVKQDAVSKHEEEKREEVEEEKPAEKVRRFIGPDVTRDKPIPSIEDRIADSRKLLDSPLQPGMALFESPEGLILLGEEKNGQVWCRDAGGGKGMWINKRR